jgi:uncharacterized protein YndB with AHSA1/START domain
VAATRATIRPAARASVTVPLDRTAAFRLFTEQIGTWWRRGERFWHDPSRGVSHRIEPRVGGRLLEVYEDGVWELGRVLAWEPPTRLAFSWRQSNWEPKETTTVEIRFLPDGDGTRVDLEHTGWEGVHSQVGCELGYEKGWSLLLGWFSGHAAP